MAMSTTRRGCTADCYYSISPACTCACGGEHHGNGVQKVGPEAVQTVGGQAFIPVTGSGSDSKPAPNAPEQTEHPADESFASRHLTRRLADADRALAELKAADRTPATVRQVQAVHEIKVSTERELEALLAAEAGHDSAPAEDAETQALKDRYDAAYAAHHVASAGGTKRYLHSPQLQAAAGALRDKLGVQAAGEHMTATQQRVRAASADEAREGDPAEQADTGRSASLGGQLLNMASGDRLDLTVNGEPYTVYWDAQDAVGDNGFRVPGDQTGTYEVFRGSAVDSPVGLKPVARIPVGPHGNSGHGNPEARRFGADQVIAALQRRR